MKIAYFDTVGGIAGDMTLAALVSAGLPLDALVAELRTLGVEGFDLHARHVRRSSIDAVHIEVAVSHEPHIHRDLNGITGLIRRSGLAASVKERAIAIFTVLGEAEAHVHDTTIDKIHFHEVGAIDSIVDIVGVSIGLDILGVEAVYSSPVRLGRGGMITTQHGPMPTPAPATLQILRDYPVEFTAVEHELTTPTGAAIIKALSRGTLDREHLRVHSVGYGAGTHEIPELPNFLRVVIGELEAATETDDVFSVETNIDDMNPQMYPVIIEGLLGAGAHDAYLVPVIMKKGRPGILLSVLTPASTLDAITAYLYRETSTIGLRVQHIGRRKLPRRELTAETSLGPVRAKAVMRDGQERITAEFEECRRLARERGIPLQDVIRRLDQELRRPS
jgi:pyridinium-3,5-bisthiocarboxylic acid mononucleotide nickel chelatase